MKELKRHQPALGIEEQVQNLKDIGLIIKDDDYAKMILNDISYFRLIKAYSLNLKPKNGIYNEGVTFEQIVDLYLFNANFRQLLFPQIEKIEINLRCRIANIFAQKYGVMGYKNSDNFQNSIYHGCFIKDIEDEIRRNLRAPFVKNFKENYEESDLPIYALVEIFSFGILSKFYKNMKNEDKKAVAKTFGTGYTYCESWFESISYVRNICAHYGRIYNAKLAKTPIIYKEYRELGIKNNRIFSVLLCMKQLLKGDYQWELFVQNIFILIDKYENIDIGTMGFPDEWEELLRI